MTIADAKAALRAEVRGRRSSRTQAELAAAGNALAARAQDLLDGIGVPGPALVTAYLSLPAEPPTDPLLAALTARGHGVWVPRIEGRDLVWVAFRPRTPLHPGPLGIREPVGPPAAAFELDGLDVLLIPGLAVDGAGRRLGQGGGYYDRMLSGIDPHRDGGPLRVVVLFDDEVLPSVPTEDHDARVDAVLTPAGYVPVG